ncbi:polymorphic toxin-type HINT domain-containing protein [Streptosporangium sp. NPDC051023]|uniref:polymorphic toxin-type HINT domain-containing protein n=1 Tax=Streptosporangium sp. NPDC051023 TaxID=3155410 RepID=UPI00344D7ED1
MPSKAAEHTRETKGRTGGDAKLMAAGGCDSEPCIRTFNVYPQDDSLVETLTPLMTGSARIYGPYSGGIAGEYSFSVHCNMDMEHWENLCAQSGWIDDGSWRMPSGLLQWGKEYCVEFGARYYEGTVDWEFSCFVTGIRQPVVASMLGTSGANGQEFHQLPGNYTTTVTDAQVSSVGDGLAVTRSYNSLDPRKDGIFGAGWSTRWDMRIRPETGSGAQTLLVTYPQGQILRFIAKGDGTFQPPPGTYATLAEVTGGGWRLMDKSSTVYVFDAQGRLLKVTDSRGRDQNLVYGTDGKLAKATATGGRSLTFTWNGTHVASVSTDQVNGTPLTWSYTYDGDKLTQACSPLQAPNCTTYTYTSGSLYKDRVLDADPVGYWRLGENGTGSNWHQPRSCVYDPTAAVCTPPAAETARDLTGISGTAIYDGVTQRGRPGPLAGTGDTAVLLDGPSWSGSTYIRLPRNALASRHIRMSAEMWFKTTKSGVLMSAADTRSRYGYTGGSPNEEPIPTLLYIGTDGKLRGQLYRGATASNVMTTSATVNNGQWHHVIITGDGPTETLYLDGQQVATRTGSQPDPELWLEYARVGTGQFLSDWPGAPSPGPYAYSTFNFEGEVDEVAIYDKALSLGQVTDHYAARVAAPHLLEKITLPSGRVWAQNTYDAATDRLKTHTDRNGGTWTLSEPVYDQATDLSTVTVTDPRNETLKYTHDAWRGYRLTSQTDQLLKKTSYDYDTGGFLSKVEDPNGNVSESFHDARGNTISTKQCRTAGNCQTAYNAFYLNNNDPFDPRNDRLLVSRDARSSSATDNTYATISEYTAYGDLAKVTTPATPDFPNGRSTTYTYTDGTEPAIGGGTIPAGLPKSQKNAKGDETTYRYTAAGDLAEQTSPSGLVTAFTYDAVGQVTSRKEISQANPDGVTTAFTYDGVGRLLTQTAPGVKNEVTNVTHTAKATYTYDADGNKLTETLADLTGGDPARTTTYTYDTHGRVETVTDPENGVTRAAWDATGAQVSATDPLGTVTTFGYTKRGEPATKTLKNWTGSPVSPQPAQDVVLESNAYDFTGRLASKVDAMGRKTSYTYFTDNRVSQVIADDVRLNGSTTTTDVVLQDNTYDAAGNLTKQVTGGGKTTVDYVYDAAGRTTSTTLDPAALKRKTAYIYDAADNVTRRTYTGAGTTRTEVIDYQYSALGQVTRQTVENGATDLVTTWTYDDRGILTAQTDPRGNASGATAADFTITLRHDLAGQLVETKAPQVKIEKNGSAADGRPVVKYGYDAAGLRTHVVEPEGRTIVSVFDKVGRPTLLTNSSYIPPGGTAVIPKIEVGYDAAGRRTTITDERGYVTTTQYDALGNPVRVTDPGPSGPGGQWVSEFDLLGEELAQVDPTGGRIEATYDDLGRKITQTQIERKPTTAAFTTTLTYDTAGNLTKSVAPGSGNRTATYTVNAAGDITSTTDPLLHTSTLDYDLQGREIKATDALGNATETEYDLAGRKIANKDLNSTSALVRTLGFGYDLAGNRTSTTSGEGHVTHAEFDALNRMTSLIEPVTASKSITTTFGYDATGSRTRTTDGRGNPTWTTYNTLGLAESVIEPVTTAHPAAVDRTWTTLYDAAGNPVSTLQPGGVRIDRTFDPVGQMVKQIGSGASVTTPGRDISYDPAGRRTAIGDYTLEYNDRGLLTKVSKATNQVATYAYDALGNPTQRVDPTGTANFTWDNANRLATAGDPVTGRSWTYGYDNADRLTSQTSANPVNTQSYTYDAVDRLASHTLKNSGGTELAKIVYGWDKDDNLTTKTTTGTAGAGTNAYAYDRTGRLTSWTAPGGATTDYEWDDAGNRTKAGSKTYTYDERNRLTSGDSSDYAYTPRGTLATETKAGVTKNLTFDAFDQLISDGDATYGYDALGRMTSRTQGGNQQRFTYSGLENDVVAVADAANTTLAKYGRDPFGGLLSLQEGGTAALGVMTDLHGDLVGTFSGTALTDSVAYDPFGEVTHRSGTRRTLGYQGEYTDPDTGKVNMYARWYQPGTGAFTSRDSVTLTPDSSVQVNRYTYANAAPLSNSDPDGHAARDTSTMGSPISMGGARIAYPESDLPQFGSISITPGYNPEPTVPGGRINEENDGLGWIPPLIDPREAERIGYTEEGRPKEPTTGLLLAANPPLLLDSSGMGACMQVNSAACKKIWKQCDIDYSKSACDAWRAAAREVILLRKFKEGCTVGKVGKGLGDKACSSLVGLLQMDTEDWKRLVDKAFWDSLGKAALRALNATIEFFIEDAVGCMNGSFSSCAWLTLDLASARGLRIMKGMAKAFIKLGEGLKKVEKLCNSFLPGTEVLMADGSRKPIEEVRTGDHVVATDPDTGESGARTVIALLVSSGTKELVRLRVDTDGAAGDETGQVVATMGHPIWAIGRNRWIDAGELTPGTRLLASSGASLELLSADKYVQDDQQVYNLTVEGIHSYHVAVGNEDILVHNSNCTRIISEIGKDSLLTRAAEEAGKSNQSGLDALFKELLKGNMNPGIGSSHLGSGTDVMYARTRRGARLFYRNVNGVIVIVGKSNKKNEQKVIDRLINLYGK